MIVVGLCGLAGAGKSTAARHLVERHGFVRWPFARVMKDMLRTLLLAQGAREGEVERMVDGDLKEAPSRYLGGQSPRLALQTLGTEWGRSLAPNLWVEAWAASLAGLERVVADDVRFPNEATAVREQCGLVLEVHRPGLARLAGSHASEAGVEPDAIVMNGGTAADLARSMTRALGW